MHKFLSASTIFNSLICSLFPFRISDPNTVPCGQPCQPLHLSSARFDVNLLHYLKSVSLFYTCIQKNLGFFFLPRRRKLISLPLPYRCLDHSRYTVLCFFSGFLSKSNISSQMYEKAALSALPRGDESH